MSKAKHWSLRSLNLFRKGRKDRAKGRFLRVEPLESRNLLASLSVTDAGDGPDINPGDGICATATSVCTLRAAIQESNALAGTDTIGFNITGAGPHTIQPATLLPALSETAVIDGTSQPGYVDTPLIEIDGSLILAANSDGLRLSANGSTVQGLAINRFTGDGIEIVSNGNVIRGNFIGTDPGGSMDRGNGRGGVSIVNGSGNVVGGTMPNLISGNGGNGVYMTVGGSNTIRNNKIGTNLDGTASIENQGRGVLISGSAGNFVGGTGANEGNLISGNRAGGIAINGATATGNTIQQNLIGTTADGTASVPNMNHGIFLATAGNTVGGTGATAGNVVSGNTQAGIFVSASGTTIVRNNLVGTNAAGTAAVGNGATGILLRGATGSTIHGNVVSGNDRGIQINGGSNNTVQNNSVGTNAAGTSPIANAHDGIQVHNSSANQLLDNLVSGNLQTGILISGAGSTNNDIENNKVGTNAGATSAIANRLGVVITAAAQNSVSGNVVSGNTFNGVSVLAGGSQNTFTGNWIGTNGTGDDLGNGRHGIVVSSSSNNTFGGTGVGEGNVISGNSKNGVVIYGVTSTGNKIQQNLIGVNPGGTAALANGRNGVSIVGSANNTIGGTSTSAGNVISGNGQNGIAIVQGASGNKVEQNLIGVGSNGTTAIGNVYHGVRLASSGSIVGGSGANAGNVIAHNGQAGVAVDLPTSIRNRIERNSIFQNGGLGIDLGVDGATANDTNDPDTGANNLQNSPALSSVQRIAGTVTIGYSIDSAAPNSAYPVTIEIFKADAGEGKTYLGSQLANSSGFKSQNFTPAVPVNVGDVIVLVAIDANGNTSEFGNGVQVLF